MAAVRAMAVSRFHAPASRAGACHAGRVALRHARARIGVATESAVQASARTGNVPASQPSVRRWRGYQNLGRDASRIANQRGGSDGKRARWQSQPPPALLEQQRQRAVRIFGVSSGACHRRLSNGCRSWRRCHNTWRCQKHRHGAARIVLTGCGCSPRPEHSHLINRRPAESHKRCGGAADKHLAAYAPTSPRWL